MPWCSDAALGIWLASELAGGAPPCEIDPPVVVAACAGFMLLVGILACVAPTIRRLMIPPVEALKEG